MGCQRCQPSRKHYCDVPFAEMGNVRPFNVAITFALQIKTGPTAPTLSE